MGYKISGTLTHNARVIVIEESGWTIEDSSSKTAGSFEVEVTDAGPYTITARRDSENPGS